MKTFLSCLLMLVLGAVLFFCSAELAQAHGGRQRVRVIQRQRFVQPVVVRQRFVAQPIVIQRQAFIQQEYAQPVVVQRFVQPYVVTQPLVSSIQVQQSYGVQAIQGGGCSAFFSY